MNAYITVAQDDPDPWMASAALGQLAYSSPLTVEHLEFLRNHPGFQKPGLQKIVVARHLISRMRSEPTLNDNFEIYISSGHREVHKELLKRQDLSKEQLIELSTRGAVRAIRNQAAQRLNRFGNKRTGSSS